MHGIRNGNSTGYRATTITGNPTGNTATATVIRNTDSTDVETGRRTGTG